MEVTNNKIIYGGMGFLEALCLLFIYLKLTDKIDWSWWKVLSPLWIPALVVLSILAIIGIIWLIVWAFLKLFWN